MCSKRCARKIINLEDDQRKKIQSNDFLTVCWIHKYKNSDLESFKQEYFVQESYSYFIPSSFQFYREIKDQ